MCKPEIIEPSRLILKPPRHGDAKMMAHLANDKGISERLATMPYPYGTDDAIFWINAVTDMVSGHAVSIFLKSTGQFIGCCGSGPIDDGDEIDFGYWIGRPFWGNGYATEAGTAILNRVFEVDRFEVITTDYVVSNFPSARVLEKLGFKAAGRRRKFSAALQCELETVKVKLYRNDWLKHQLCTID